MLYGKRARRICAGRTRLSAHDFTGSGIIPDPTDTAWE
jgi:hypothetical protein